MIRSIWTPSLVAILPPSVLRDSKIRAAAEALDLELEKLSAATREALLLPRLDELPHATLDVLANQYHCDFFEPTEMDADTKRKLIRNSILDHRIKGTPAAVLNLLNKITRGATIQEWFEYGGRPYYFRVTMKGLLDYSDSGETFMRMVEATKNARSWLDDIIFDLSKGHPDTSLAVGQLTLEQGNINYDINHRTNTSQSLHIVQSDLTSGRQTIGLDTNNTISHGHKIRVGAVELTHGRIRFGADIETPDDFTAEDFERYLRKRWLQFKDNPVVKYYKHHEHVFDDGELDDPDEPEYFPLDTDFLRIYWKFTDDTSKFHVRYQTLLNPREDVEGREIRALGEIGAAGGILLHSKKKIPTTGIFRALYIHKTETRII